MKMRQLLKSILLGASIVGIGYLLRGHDILTGIALGLLALTVLSKLVFAFRFNRAGLPPGGEDSAASGRLVPRPPGGGPRRISAAADREKVAAA
jgi:hypothetical protein